MPNYCNYEMKIVGKKSAIKRVIKCLNAGYDYGVGKPANKHFFRVFEVNDEDGYEKNEDGTFTKYVWGDCAWSVHSCMCEGEGTYYDDLKKAHPDIFMGTTLLKQSKKCIIEVFSEEWGCAFSEHYIFDNGVCMCDKCVEIEFEEESDDCEGVFNPNRVNNNESFKWTY